MGTMTITAGTILGMFLNISAVDDGEFFAYNADMQEGKVSAIYTYDRSESGLYLSKNTKDVYKYDAQDRVISKETRRWNARRGSWEPVCCRYFAYTETGVTVDYAVWNRAEASFAAPVERMVYWELGDNLYSVERYQRTKDEGEMLLVDTYVLMQSEFRHLLAGL